MTRNSVMRVNPKKNCGETGHALSLRVMAQNIKL